MFRKIFSVPSGLRGTRIGYSRRIIRCYSTETTSDSHDILSRLKGDLKTAMKAKDSSTSTIIRTVLSDIYAAQKDSSGKTLQQSDFFSIIRKAHQRRLDAAAQFEVASRSDMAEKERGEAKVLSSYLPAVLEPSEIDTLLRDILKIIPEDTKKDSNASKAKGLVIKEVYKRVDKSRVRGEVLKQQLDKIWVAQN